MSRSNQTLKLFRYWALIFVSIYTKLIDVGVGLEE
jgi:hypothetical protein